MKPVRASVRFCWGRRPACCGRVLAPPSTWNPSPDPLEHRLIDVDPASEEGTKLLAAFRASLKEHEGLEVVGLKRNENVSLWQR